MSLWKYSNAKKTTKPTKDDENIKYWIGKIKDKSRLRKFVEFLKVSYEIVMEQQGADVEQILMSAEEKLTNLTALEIDDHVDGPADMANLGYDEVEKRFLRYKNIN